MLAIRQLFSEISIVIISVKIVSVLLFLDGSLNFVERLLDELAILHVKDAIGVAFDFWIMCHHNTCRCTVLTFSLWAHSVDVQDQVHDCN